MNCTSYLILEKEELGASFLRWPEEMRFITPSFPAQGFGQTDLNAIVPKTSPAYTLDMEHPTGEAYAEYLDVVAEHFDIPIKKGVQVNHIHKMDGIFSIDTTQATYQSRYVVWAAGQYQYPELTPFPGQGSLLMNMSVSEVFILVYLASTFSACLVTLFTISRELRWKTSLSIGWKQMLTSVMSTAFLASGVYFL